MYKKTESPTMELVAGICDHQIIEKCFEFCQSSKIERLIINFNEENIKELSFILKEMEFNTDVCVFFRCNSLIFESLRAHISDIPVILIVDNMEELSVEQYDSSSIFFEITFNGTFSEKLDEIKSSIIWNIPFSEYHWNEFDNSMDTLMKHYQDADLMIKQIVLTKTLIKEHPCNVYLCSSAHCHSNHGDFPRSLFVSVDGSVFPYGLEDARLCIGSIMSNYDVLFNAYNNSKEKQEFIKLNREVYLDTIDKCCYELIPWFELIKGRLDEC